MREKIRTALRVAPAVGMIAIGVDPRGGA